MRFAALPGGFLLPLRRFAKSANVCAQTAPKCPGMRLNRTPVCAQVPQRHISAKNAPISVKTAVFKGLTVIIYYGIIKIKE